jgi:hypothetical protein
MSSTGTFCAGHDRDRAPVGRRSGRRGDVCQAVWLLQVLFAPVASWAQAPPACLPETRQSFLAAGVLQTYTVARGATELLISAAGAAGAAGVVAGGRGTSIMALVPVTGVATLNVVVGSVGIMGTTGYGGGGGGTFVYTPANMLLLAAGGGGGTTNTRTDDLSDARLDTMGNSGGLGGAAGGTAGSGGGGQFSGGGAGFLGDGMNGSFGKGGHRISSPGDAAGGAGGVPGGGAGGFGGGGGAGREVTGGGGGGGYSGGGGAGEQGGGGGGSFVAPGATILSAAVTNTGDGLATICVTATAVAATPTLAPSGVATMAVALAIAGSVLVRRKRARCGSR